MPESPSTTAEEATEYVADDHGLDLRPAETPAPDLRADSLADSVVVLLALTVVQRLVGFVRGVLFCRWLSPEELGQWDLAFGFLMLAGPAAVLGLSGSLGRYVEQYRQQGQLRSLLRATTWGTTACALVFIAAMFAAPEFFAELVFGRADHDGLIWLLTGTLVVTIVYNHLTSLFTALRRARLVSLLQFVNTVVFAAVGVVLLYGWSATTTSVVAAFAVSYLLSAAGYLFCLRQLWRDVPQPTTALPNTRVWRKLMPFALSLWLTNWVSNLFDLADRFMIVHVSGLAPAAALDLVGQYHSARVLPLLFLGVAELLSNTMTPHLSHDWEAGRRSAVSHRLGLVMKAFTMAVLVIACGVLIVAPWLFHVALAGKFGMGLGVLPLALAFCIWAGLSAIGNNYLWCAERSRYVTLAYTVGLVANVMLNAWLMPAYGLWGAVASTAVSRWLMFSLLLVFIGRAGMAIDRGLLIITLLPAALLLGPWVTIVLVVLTASGLVRPVACFTAPQQAELAAFAVRLWRRKPVIASA